MVDSANYNPFHMMLSGLVRVINKYWFFIIPVVFKISLAAIFWGSTDINNVRGASEALFVNVGIKHNYLSPVLVMHFLNRIIEDAFVIPINITQKLFPILSELGISIFIYWYIKDRFSENQTKILIILYLLNPINIYISVFHGQFDSVAIFLTIFSVYLLGKTAPKMMHIIFSAISFSLAIGIKVFPLLFLPVILVYPRISLRSKIYFTFFTAVFLLLPVLAHPQLSLTEVINYFKYPLSYKSYGIFGLDGILGLLGSGFHQYYRSNLRLIACLSCSVGALIVIKKKLSLYRGFLIYILAILAFSTSMAPQYLVWLVPFIFISNSILGIFFSFVLGFFLPWYYLLPSDNSGVFAALTSLSFLTPSSLIYYFKFPKLTNFIDINVRWRFLALFLITWFIIVSLSKTKAQVKKSKTESFRLPGKFLSVCFILVFLSTVCAVYLEWVTTHNSKTFVSKEIVTSQNAKPAYFLYGYNIEQDIIIPKWLELKQVTIDGGDYLKVSLNNQTHYYYGNQHWDYHGGWRSTRAAYPMPIDSSTDNSIHFISNITSVRPEYFVNINDDRNLTDTAAYPKVTPVSLPCTLPVISQVPCSISVPHPSNWHLSIVEAMLVYNVIYLLAFIKFVDRKQWSWI